LRGVVGAVILLCAVFHAFHSVVTENNFVCCSFMDKTRKTAPTMPLKKTQQSTGGKRPKIRENTKTKECGKYTYITTY
jgi:hypothetical protein